MYAGGDPIGRYDLDGRCFIDDAPIVSSACDGVGNAANWGANAAADATEWGLNAAGDAGEWALNAAGDGLDWAGDRLHDFIKDVCSGDGPLSLDLNISGQVGIGVETGLVVGPDCSIHPYVGGGGGLGGGLSLSSTTGAPEDGPTGQGCVVACVGADSGGGASFGVGPKASAGVFYRVYLGD